MKQIKLKQLIIAAFLMLLIGQSQAENTEKMSDLSILEGHWKGQLQYRDYGSDRQVSIPMEVTIEMSPDQQFVISNVTYTDPGYKVYAHVVTRFDEKNKKVYEYYFSNGQIEEKNYDINWIQHGDDKWMIEYSNQGQDAGQKADIRIRKTISKTEYISQQWVDNKKEAPFIRNQTLLKKIQ